MENFDTIEQLINAFRKLPGVGVKSAERMAYQMLDAKEGTIDEMISALQSIKTITKCPICSSYQENGICPFCDDSSRTNDTIVVTSFFKDALAFEKLKTYHGLYHILNGSISPSKGIGVNDINITTLFNRINEGTKEIILATNPTLEGETTALYISKLLEKFPNIKVTRLAYGLPMGGQLDYADELTLTKALEGRSEIRKD